MNNRSEEKYVITRKISFVLIFFLFGISLIEEKDNQRLSEESVSAIKNILIKSGIDVNGLTTICSGKSKFINANSIPDSKDGDQCIEIIII